MITFQRNELGQCWSPHWKMYSTVLLLFMWSNSLYQQEEAGGGAECWGGATHHHLCQPEEGSWCPCQVTGENGGQYTGKFVYYTVKTIVNDHPRITAKWYFKRVGLWWVICLRWNMQRIIIWLYCDWKKVLFQWAFQLVFCCCFLHNNYLHIRKNIALTCICNMLFLEGWSSANHLSALEHAENMWLNCGLKKKSSMHSSLFLYSEWQFRKSTALSYLCTSVKKEICSVQMLQSSCSQEVDCA